MRRIHEQEEEGRRGGWPQSPASHDLFLRIFNINIALSHLSTEVRQMEIGVLVVFNGHRLEKGPSGKKLATSPASICTVLRIGQLTPLARELSQRADRAQPLTVHVGESWRRFSPSALPQSRAADPGAWTRCCVFLLRGSRSLQASCLQELPVQAVPSSWSRAVVCRGVGGKSIAMKVPCWRRSTCDMLVLVASSVGRLKTVFRFSWNEQACGCLCRSAWW